ncbi:TPR-like protein [Cadophora sp. DSE1049]|nr:TPR-like protein [Cadophora sp. DSE1049]
MDPPKIPQPTRRYKNEEWEVHRGLIVGMYPMQGMKLKAIKEMLEQEHNFIVNERQLKKKIEDWKIAKNVQSSEMEFIVRKQKQRTMTRTSTHFRVRGQPVEPGKISRWQKRSGNSSIVTNSREAPSPQMMVMGYHPNLSSGSSMMKWSPNMNEEHHSSLQPMILDATPAVSTDTSLNVITDSEFSSFEGQSPAPFTPISSPYRDMLSAVSTTSLPLDINVSDKSHAAPRKTRYREAEELDLRQRLDQLESKYGSNHPATLDTMFRLSGVLRDQGRLRSAEQYNKQVAELFQATFGEDDLRTIEAFHNLAIVLHFQSNLVPAERLCQRLSRKVMKLAQGSENINTMSTQSSLAFIYANLGRLQESESLLRQVFADQTRVLGAEHREAVKTQTNLAYVLNFQERYEESEQLLQSAIQKSEKTLGEKHIDTLRYRGNLVETFVAQRKFEKAVANAKEVLAIATEAIGGYQEVCFRALGHLGISYRAQGRLEKALEMFRLASEGSARMLGDDHLITTGHRREFMEVKELIAQESNAGGVQAETVLT